MVFNCDEEEGEVGVVFMQMIIALPQLADEQRDILLAFVWRKCEV